MRKFLITCIPAIFMILGIFAEYSTAAAKGATENSSPTLYVCIYGSMSFFEIGRLPEQDPIAIARWTGEKERLRREESNYILERYQNWRSRPTTAGLESAWEQEMILRPSNEAPGDLDLVKYYQWDLTKLELPPEHPGMKPRPFIVPSYLHRMTDPRVKQYFSVAKELRSPWDRNPPSQKHAAAPTTVTATLIGLARKMVADAPDDLYSRFFLMDALIAQGDAKAIASEIDFWRARSSAWPSTSVFRYALGRFEWTLHAMELSGSGRNAYDFITKALSPGSDMDLMARLRVLPELLRYEEYACPWQPSHTDLFSSLGSSSAEIFDTGAILFLLQGNRARSLETSMAIYHLGQLMSQNDTLINRMRGIAIRGTGAQSLGLFVLNGCERPEEVEAAWQKLEWLNQREKLQTRHELFSFDPIIFYLSDEDLAKIPPPNGPNTSAALTWQGVSDTQFQLVRLAAGGWHRYLRTGQFPKQAGDFDLLASGAPPRDPFGDGPLRFTETSSSLMCYGLGPNHKDEGSAISYDPTNGTISVGDIILEVPRERKYPVPKGGVKAASKEDLLRQFPNGLPPDDFVDRKGRPLGITNTSPVCVYSIGPGTNQYEVQRQGDAYIPAVIYDPTNGTTSAGNLTLMIPKP